MLFLSNSESKSDYLDSNKSFISIVNVSDFNGDSSHDTLVAFASNNGLFFPKQILWGKDTIDNEIPDSLKIEKTLILYPDWIELNGSASIDDFNSDTLSDILLIIWGKIQLDTINQKDTSTSIIIFGRKGLDTISTINLTSLDTFQTYPVFAMNMRLGKEFSEPKIRDLSYNTSFVINNINVGDTSLNMPRQKPKDETTIKPFVNIYPNPAYSYLNIEINCATYGDYHFGFYSLEGVELLSNSKKVENVSTFIQEINISSLNSGFYIIRITKDREFIGVHKLIVIH